MCDYYCEQGELYCYIDDDNFSCTINTLDYTTEDGDETIEFTQIYGLDADIKDPGTTMTAYVACIERTKYNTPLDEWIKIPAKLKSVDESSYSFTIDDEQLPQTPGAYYCVGVVNAIGGGDYICPDNYLMKGIRTWGDDTASDLMADDDSYVKLYIAE
jgi:hypothetical protein